MILFVLDCIFTTFLSLIFSYLISILISLDSSNNESQSQSKLSDHTTLNSESKTNKEQITKTESFQSTPNEPVHAKLTTASLEIEQGCRKDEVIKFDTAFISFENRSANLSFGATDDGQAGPEAENSEDKVDEGKDVDDGGWEGIERTDLEKRFSKAVKFVKSSQSIPASLPKIDEDLKLKLYGLHKLATEGHCCVSRPTPFKFSARAKWNVWKQLGEMSPDSAMEQYMTLQSEHFPQWTMGSDDLDVYGHEYKACYL